MSYNSCRYDADDSKFRARHEPKTRLTKRVQRGVPWESLFMRKSRTEKRVRRLPILSEQRLHGDA